jgi:hypothetical protein
MAFMPTTLIILVTVSILQFAYAGFFSLGSLVFPVLVVGFMLVILEHKRKEAIKEIQGFFRGLYRPGE